MPLIVPSTQKDIHLEDDAAYTATLTAFEVVDGTAYGDPTKTIQQLKLVLQLGDDPEATKWIFANHSVGKAQGRVSKLRQLLNAFAGRSEDTGIVSYNTDTFEWTYADGKSFKLRAGLTLTFRGTNFKNDEGFDRFRFEKFKPAGTTTAKVAADDDIPF